MKHLLLSALGLLFTATVFSQHLDTTTVFHFSNNAWQPDGRAINSYNSSCLIDSTIGQLWDSTNSVWQNVSKSIFSYTDTLRSQETHQIWTQTNTWRNLIRSTNTYNANNKLTVSFGEV